MSKLLLREGLKTIAVVLLRLSYLPVHQEGIHPTFLTMKIRCLSLWRILVDPTIDTDRDGSPDWAEFEIAARGTGVLIPDVIGNPFDADTNADGTPDGEQLDAELDGTADAKDPDAADETAVFPLGPEPRYALFPITNAVVGSTSDRHRSLTIRGGCSMTPELGPEEHGLRLPRPLVRSHRLRLARSMTMM